MAERTAVIEWLDGTMSEETPFDRIEVGEGVIGLFVQDGNEMLVSVAGSRRVTTWINETATTEHPGRIAKRMVGRQVVTETVHCPKVRDADRACICEEKVVL